ncbi:hypothetical protein A6S26_18845 [Nostoc sp. ATCC 43529]|nr:hypothetical protein A6S26_18845 [Nostoc sp. ATCC 43529]
MSKVEITAIYLKIAVIICDASAELARTYGLEVMWFSDAFDFCAASPDWEILLYISKYATSPWFYLAGKKQSRSWISEWLTSPPVEDFWQFLKRSEAFDKI